MKTIHMNLEVAGFMAIGSGEMCMVGKMLWDMGIPLDQLIGACSIRHIKHNMKTKRLRMDFLSKLSAHYPFLMDQRSNKLYGFFPNSQGRGVGIEYIIESINDTLISIMAYEMYGSKDIDSNSVPCILTVDDALYFIDKLNKWLVDNNHRFEFIVASPVTLGDRNANRDKTEARTETKELVESFA